MVKLIDCVPEKGYTTQDIAAITGVSSTTVRADIPHHCSPVEDRKGKTKRAVQFLGRDLRTLGKKALLESSFTWLMKANKLVGNDWYDFKRLGQVLEHPAEKIKYYCRTQGVEPEDLGTGRQLVKGDTVKALALDAIEERYK